MAFITSKKICTFCENRDTNINYKEYKIFIDYKSLQNIDYIYKNSIVLNRSDKYDFIEIKIYCDDINYNKIIKKIGVK